jgi:hypothetical protein
MRHAGMNHPRIYYNERGFFKGMKRVDEPSNSLCIAESHYWSDVLNAVLWHEDEEAVHLARDGLQKLVASLAFNPGAVRDFLYHNKSGDIWRYLGFTPRIPLNADEEAPSLLMPNGKPDFNKISFRTCAPEEAGFTLKGGKLVAERKLGKSTAMVEVKTDPASGLRYADEPHPRLVKGSKPRQFETIVRRIWFMDERQARPDVSLYAYRLREEPLELLEGIMGPDARHWLTLNADANGAIDALNPLISLQEFEERTRKTGVFFEGAPPERKRRKRR